MADGSAAPTLLGQRRADPAAELAVLGACFTSPAALALARAMLTADDFATSEHGACFAALGALADRGEDVDRVTLTAELRTRRCHAAVTAKVAFDDLEFFGTGAARVEAHARIVADLADAWRIRAASVELARLASDEGCEPAALRERAAALLGAATARVRGAGPRTFRELADAFCARLMEQSERPPGISGLTTGLRGLDDLLAGLHPGDLIVLGARPRVGKTSLAMQMAVAAAKAADRPVLGFSLEMSALNLFTRTVCARAGIEGTGLRQNSLTQAEFNDLSKAALALAELPVLLDDTGLTTVADIRAKAIAQKARGGLALVFCDYLQLVEATSSRAGTREREVAMMSRSLKMLARELDVPVIVLSQLNREVDKRTDNRPMLSDLRESGSLEQDADVVMFLYRDVLYHPDTKQKDSAEVIVAKHRNGPTDTIEVKWEGAFTRFADLERDEPPPGEGSDDNDY